MSDELNDLYLLLEELEEAIKEGTEDFLNVNDINFTILKTKESINRLEIEKNGR